MLDEETIAAETPQDAKPWLAMIKEAEKVFSEWQDKSDNIDKQYANLARLASISRDREFQLFWANVQVLGPSVYSKPPVPVVIPRFKDRSSLKRDAAEVLERSNIIVMADESIDDVMKIVRDDLITVGRGVAWIRLDDGEDVPKVCIENVDRKDFLHDAARTWKEVDWVARRAWLTNEGFRERFPDADTTSITAKAISTSDNGDDYLKKTLRIDVWEIWCKSKNVVVWVTDGVEAVLDIGKPHLDLEGFFPCPRPAYATIERGKLIPVPDFAFYKDQSEEIDEVTARIHSLTDALRLKGFYPGGAGEIADAVETAIRSNNDNALLIPISNWAMLGGQNAKDMIVWFPIDTVAATITGLIELRKQLIDDVYQIMGLSDIMRGSSVASETLGAQQLKSQYGSVRIRDKQEELVRFARDIVCIVSEIMAENFTPEQFLEMSQMQLPRAADIKQQAMQIQQQLQQIQMDMQTAMQDPNTKAMAEQNPEQAQQVMQQAQQQVQGLQGELQKLGETVTIDKIVALFRDQRIRGFTLDIETDSTIAPDENAQKQRATEYITAMTGLLSNAMPAVQAMPQAAPLMADVIKFANSQFRVGRAIEQSVEDFTDQMKQLAQQPKSDPAVEQGKKDAEAMQAKIQADMQALEAKTAADLKLKEQDAALAKDGHERDMQAKAQEHDFKMQEMEHQRFMREADLRAKQVDFEHRTATHDQSMAAAKQNSEAGQQEFLAKSGIPPGYSFDDDREQFKAIMSEIAASREGQSQLVALVSQGQQEIAKGLEILAAVNAAPVKITSPEGRTFVKQPMVN